MSTATKAAIAATSVGGGALGGAALGGAFNSSSSKQPTTSVTTPQDDTKPQTLTPTSNKPAALPQPQEPDWKPLTVEITSNVHTYDNKIGKEYHHLLVGPYGNPDNSNKSWWNKKLTIYNNDKSSNSNSFSEEFSSGKVTSGFAEKNAKDNNPEKALNKVCDSVYQKTTSDITPTKNTQDNKPKLKVDLWKYCSNLETPPKTVEEEPTEDKTYSGSEYGLTKKSELLSVKKGVNEVIWNLKQKEFFALTSVDDKFFKKLYETKNTNTSPTALKDKCKDAYSKTAPNEDTAPSDANTVKYCSAKAIS